MAVTLVDGRIGAQAVQIAFPIDIFDPNSLPFRDDDIKRRVVVGTVLCFQVNIVGCFLIGIFTYLVEAQSGITSEMRLFLIIGLLGSFTTYSTFSNETINLLQDQKLFLAFSNIRAHIIFGLIAVLLGRFAIMTLWR